MFAISERARQVFDDLNHFVDQRVRPAEIVFREQMKDAPEPFWRPPILQELKAEARWQDADELRWAARHWAARIGVKLKSAGNIRDSRKNRNNASFHLLLATHI